MLSNTLTKVCEENGRLSGQISALEEKVQALAQEPLKETPVLQSLFEPEKTGWFGGSKSAAREQLEQLSDALQSEFISYKASHASSNDEVQALVEGLHNAHLNAQELSNTVKEQQQLISSGPLAVAVHIVPVDEGNSCAATAQELQAQLRRVREQAARTEDALRSSQAELLALKAENAKLRNDSVASSTPLEPAAAAPMPAGNSALLLSEMSATEALKRMTSERDALQDALAEARDAIVEKDKDAELQKHKVAQLESKLAAKDSVHMEEVDKLRQQLETARRDVDASHITVQGLRSQILEMTVQQEERHNALEKRLADALDQLSAKDDQLRHLSSVDDYENLKLEQESLTREIDLYKQRIAFLETSRSASDDAANATALNDAEVLETLNATKERISKLEFERDQLVMQLQQAQSYAVSRDAEARQLQQRSEDDKKRVAFLMKKCASLTADVRSATTQLDTFKDQFEKQSLELKQERRNTEGMARLQKQFDDLSKEKKLLEDRLAATQEMEERLVKAKETIAYMELAQSSTICMSQFAELKAEKEKLQNTMEPLDRRLEEAKQEIERLKAVTDAQHAISETQNKNVRAWQDQVTALSESEAKLRDKVAVLTAENTRLTQVNASLEQQMDDMQDGIKEMAVHMEKDRASAKAAAEANAQKQIQTLSDELAQARKTIAEVQARDGQYVADGLYQSVVAERDRSLEENKKITVELEKCKSEISIYRQTIADLEQENDERVKEIESLQDHYQSDRAALSDRLAKEQKRAAELSSGVADLTERVSAMEAEAAKHTSAITALQEKNARQQRVFEDKCRREEALTDEIKRLNGQISALQANLASVALQGQGSGSNGNDVDTTAAAAFVAAASTVGVAAPAVERCSSAVVEPETEVRATDRAALLSSLNPAAATASRPLLDRPADGAAAYAASAPEPIAIDAFCKRIEDLQRDNDRLNSELKRIQLQHRTDSANDQHMITVLQTQIKNRMSTNNRAAYEAEIAKSAALKKSIEALMEENVKLRKQAGVAQVSANMPASASSVAMAGAQQMDVLQLQSQLQAQKAAYDSAMEAAAKAAETYEARIHELEEQLHETKEAAAAAAAAAAAGGTGTGGNAADDGDASLLDRPVKRRVKKIKKKKTLAEQVGATNDGDDILAASPQADGAAATENSAEAGQLQAPLMLVHQEVDQVKLENMRLTAENTQLKATVADLLEQLQRAEEDVKAANEDMDMMQTAMNEERVDLGKRMDLLEQQSIQRLPGTDEQQLSTPLRNTGSVRNGSENLSEVNRSFRNSTVVDFEMQLRRCQDEVERLTAENRNLQCRPEREEAQRTSSLSGTAAAVMAQKSEAGDVRKLQRQLKQKDAEIKVLADQLMPTKEKLAEYMAMADRLGLRYPFPPELEGATVLRLKALHLPVHPRSASAPTPAHQWVHRIRSGGKVDEVSPPPRAPRARHIGGGVDTAREKGGDFSRR
ncbi:conserved hypothetical protein [Leishmania major strain Friedlin]|uniref:Uncharacterized protein n=1 Tax=Leishmania major TaxID=5664 RepID=Q4Q8U2_LEIMA|nr:conserved hypothetical protein [Leishmania major strain Friedlin]CAG9576576.1 hypothetical_protein_-_conserved [Leishmania major strain Friedlin]CAJ05625.1 conserved hypothetical protein [Leishmania major strain Friedlin]|eukprot:XP_001684256.1 conserved hypothetical protein [Leishmania major strain Friedlin]